MRFLDHLEILRRKLLYSLGFFLLLIPLFIVFQDPLMQFYLQPLEGIPVNLVSLRPAEKFVAYIKAAVYAALYCSLPLLLFQVGSFIYPALQGKERPLFVGILGGMVLMFLLGAFVAFEFLLPFICSFFYFFNPADGILPYWSVEGYIDLVFFTLITMSGVFQAPLLLLFLLKLGVLRLETLTRFRKHTVLGIFLVSAIITPPDVFSQVVVGSILYALFELTILIGRLFLRKGGSNG